MLRDLQVRDALQEAIYNQLTSTRKSKVQQVETYFRTIRNELSQLAGSKEAIDAARAFRATFNELDRTDVPADLRGKVDAKYGAQFMPGVQRLSATEADVKAYLPVDAAGYYLHTTTSSPTRSRPSGASWSTMPATSAPTASSTRSSTRCCATPPRPSASSTSGWPIRRPAASSRA